MRIRIVTSKFIPEEDEFIGFHFGQYRNEDGYWVFQLIIMNLGINMTPLFLTKNI